MYRAISELKMTTLATAKLYIDKMHMQFATTNVNSHKSAICFRNFTDTKGLHKARTLGYFTLRQ